MEKELVCRRFDSLKTAPRGNNEIVSCRPYEANDYW